MGRVKHMIDQGYCSDLDENICSSCIREYGISTFIIKHADLKIVSCSYCHNTQGTKGFKACNLSLVVEYVCNSISNEWCDPANVLPYQSSEGGYQGEVLNTQELFWHLGLDVDDEQIITDITDAIENEYWCKRDYFSLSPDETLIYGWEAFCKFVINNSRYFFLQANNEDYNADQHDEMNPVDILTSVASIISNLGMFKEIQISQVIKRVRIVDEYNEATTAKELGSPPLEYCNMANRMSPAGISMFYGAFELETAIKETYDPEPKLTKKAVVGNFFPCRPLKLIDLSMRFRVPGIFDDDKSHRFEKSFLFDFIKDFTKPIERADRAHIDYVPTQIVTEYLKIILSNQSNSTIDGIIYPSSKNPNHKAVVIFAGNDQSIDKESTVNDNSMLILDNYESVDLKPYN